MHELTRLMREDLQPALGVTEPGSIAFAVSTAREHTHGSVQKILVRLNSGIYKNGMTCGIPGTDRVGNDFAAALGAVAADPSRKLECLENITPDDELLAAKLIEDGLVQVEMNQMSSRIFIEATVTTSKNRAVVTIQDTHTNIVRIFKDDQTIFENKQWIHEKISTTSCIRSYLLEDLYDYVQNVSPEEITFLSKAFEMNIALVQAGLESQKTTFAKALLASNHHQIYSDDEQKTAALLCAGAVEARVLGLRASAMSMAGSGAHGILATLPLYAAAKVNHYSEEALLKACALSHLICLYIKEYSGKLSAFCGCAIAAGTGAACGLALLHGGDQSTIVHTINNMASSITGMICDGGNQGCTMKAIAAVDAAWRAAGLAMQEVYVSDIHGILGKSPEQTLQNMGRIASPGMIKTEEIMIEILNEKDAGMSRN